MVQPVVVPVVQRHGAARRASWEKPGAGVTSVSHRGKDAGQETGADALRRISNTQECGVSDAALRSS